MRNEYQALKSHTKKIRRDHHNLKGKHSHQNQKDNTRRSSRYLSNVRCYTCDEKGHFARDCPRNRRGFHKKKNNKRRHHAHTVEDDEPPRKRVKEEIEYSSSDAEYVLIYALTRTVIHGSNDWLIYSVPSKHIT